MTVGRVVLLATKSISEVESALTSALLNPDPRVRAAAARVVAVVDDGRLVDDVVAAVAAERDAQAGAELVRTVLLLRGQPAREWVEPHARRLGGPAMAVLAAWLARHDHPRFVAVLPEAAKAPGAPFRSLLGAIALAADDRQSTVDVLRAWLPVAPERAWQAALADSLTSPGDISRAEDLLLEALRSGNTAVRLETIWFLVKADARGDRLPTRIVAAAETAATAQAGGWDIFGLELIARSAARRKAVDRADFLRQEAAIGRLLANADLKRLTASESAAINERLTKAGLSTDELAELRDPRSSPTSFPPARTIDPWLPGLLEEIGRATECVLPRATGHGIARVTFRPDGRPRRAELDVTSMPPACVPVLHALAMTGFADEERRIGERSSQSQVLPLTPAFFNCNKPRSAESLRASVPYVHVDEAEGPFLTRKVHGRMPSLPAEVQRSGRPSDITAELMVSESGCVASVRVTSGSGSDAANVAVVRGMSEWVYNPVALKGVPQVFSIVERIRFAWKSTGPPR